MTRAEAHGFYRELSLAAGNDPGQKAAIVRRLCLTDLFYLMVHVLGRADMDNDWCFARCREVQAAPDGYLDLWAREHYKSTIITVGKTIQDVLSNPEITVGIISYNQDIASSFLIQIKRIFEECGALKELFPDVLWRNPKKEAPLWNTEALVVRRKTIPKEATIEALPLHKGVGKHFSLLVYDDVVMPDSVSTPEMIKKTTQNWQLSLNVGAHGGKRRMIGTRYHAVDTYSVILEQKSFIPRIYPATLDGSMEGEPAFLSAETLAEKRRDMGPYIFGCQMLQNPVADSVMGFKAEWLLYADIEQQTRRINPAGSKKAGSDYTVIAVIGLAPDGNYYLIDGVRDRLNLTERGARLFELHQRYRPLAVGYERYGMQADVEHIRAEQERRNYRFAVTELGGSMPKNDRIRRLIPLFEQGRFYLPQALVFTDAEGRARDFTREFVDEEYLAFPVAGHDDMLDCVSRIVEPDLRAVFPRSQARSRPTKAMSEYNIFG